MSERPAFKPRVRVLANVAMSADGKIDSALGEGGGFSSRHDRDRMDEIRAGVDALIVGASTLRNENPPLFVRDVARRRARIEQGRAEQLHVAIVSRSGRVPADARFLREPAESRTLALPAQVDEAALEPLAPLLEEGRLELFRAGEEGVDVAALVEHLAGKGCRRVLVEGGGETIAAFLEAGLLDELYMTLCPTFIGGRGAPSPVAGRARRLVERTRLSLAGFERVGDELYLRYEVER